MSRLPLVAANWKMNMTLDQGEVLFNDLISYPSYEGSCDVWILPTAPLISPLSRRAREERSAIRIGAQDVSGHEAGAYTGEVSAQILRSVGAHAVTVGHSERRQYHQESAGLLSAKVQLALKESLQVILCVGEQLEQRAAGDEKQVVADQLTGGLQGVSSDEMKDVVIAYEPVWAIGTGQTATPDQVQEMHAYIRHVLTERFDASVANATRILYGGSVKPHNAEELFGLPDVDGGLIGGASLKAESFMQIVSAAV